MPKFITTLSGSGWWETKPKYFTLCLAFFPSLNFMLSFPTPLPPHPDWCMGMGNRGLRSAHDRSSPCSCLMLFPCSSLASPGTAGNSVQAHGTPPLPHLHPGARRAVAHTFFPSLIAHGLCPAHPYTSFPRGTAFVSGGLSLALRWMSWSPLEWAISGRGQFPCCLGTQCSKI